MHASTIVANSQPHPVNVGCVAVSHVTMPAVEVPHATHCPESILNFSINSHGIPTLIIITFHTPQ